MNKNDNILYIISNVIFYILGLAVVWNMACSSSFRILSDNGQKIVAMAALGLYIIILLERKRRKGG